MIGEELELLTMERFRESSRRDRRERERERERGLGEVVYCGGLGSVVALMFEEGA